MKKILITLLIIIVLPIFILYITGHGYILTAVSRTYLVGNTTANINDHQQFNTRVISASKTQAWKTSNNYPKPLPQELHAQLSQGKASAFMVIHQGKIVSEKYFNGYTDRSKTNSFSMAKTIVTLMVGKAIEEGYIESLNQAATDFIPEFKNDPLGKEASIGSFSAMTSGYDWDEQYYSPFSPTVELFYGDDVEDFVLSGSFSSEPEKVLYYSSASTQILALILDRALKAKDPNWTLSKYLSQKLWQPLGMNDDALWHLDGQGMELAYCCINTNARNFAKFGQLMLQNGQWQNKQLIDADYIRLMSKPTLANNYGYSTWLNSYNKPQYYAFRGHLGQRIIIVPSHDLVIVRLGEDSLGGIEALESLYVKHSLELIQP